MNVNFNNNAKQYFVDQS